MITSTIFHFFKAFYQTAPSQESYSTSTSQVFTWIIFLVLLAQLQRTFVPYVLLRPKGMQVAAYPTIFGQWLTSLRLHVVAIDVVRSGYLQASGKLFTIPAVGKYIVFLSTREQIDEVSKAPIDQLSFNAAIDEQFLPHLIFNGFRFDPKDPRYSVPLNAMRVKLRDNLPILLPDLLRHMKKAFHIELPTNKCNKDWLEISTHTVSQRIVERLNSVVFVGEETTNDPAFLKAAMRYTRDIVVTGEVLRFMPSFLQLPVGWLTMNWSGAKNSVYKRIISLMSERMEHDKAGTQRPRDFVQWLLDATRKKSPEAITRLAQHVMGLMFGAAHQLPMVISFALYNLCKHPEYIEPLTNEIIAMEQSSKDGQRNYDDLPLMDSFLKETARLNPTMILTMPRKVLYPFQFTDGALVPKNNWLCIPQQAIMQNQAYYDDPTKFNGFRFHRPNKNNKNNDNSDPAAATGDETRFSTPSFDFPFWGSVKRPCPGRFYVSIVAKMVLSHFIMNYDVVLAKPDAPQSFAWSYALVPHPLTKMLIREKAK